MVMVVVASTSVLGESQCMYVCVLAPVSFTRSVSMSYHRTDCSTTEGLVPLFTSTCSRRPMGTSAPVARPARLATTWTGRRSSVSRTPPPCRLRCSPQRPRQRRHLPRRVMTFEVGLSQTAARTWPNHALRLILPYLSRCPRQPLRRRPQRALPPSPPQRALLPSPPQRARQGPTAPPRRSTTTLVTLARTRRSTTAWVRSIALFRYQKDMCTRLIQSTIFPLCPHVLHLRRIFLPTTTLSSHGYDRGQLHRHRRRPSGRPRGPRLVH